MVGFSSHVTFPAVKDGLVKDYGRLCDGWCHCFRQPDDYISPASPKALISESDFVDYRTVSPQTICGTSAPKKDFDFMYVCLPGHWTEMTKNWPLAKACLHRLCNDLSLNGLLLGRWQILDLPFHRNLTIVGDVPRRTALEYIGRSRIVFVPSLMDASPRLLAEALCMNVSILVNRDILGGWKYVNQSTGAFFDNEDDVAQAAAQCLSGPTEPRAWFRANYGPMRSSLRLSGFLHSLDGDMHPTASLRLAHEALAPPTGPNPGLRAEPRWDPAGLALATACATSSVNRGMNGRRPLLCSICGGTRARQNDHPQQWRRRRAVFGATFGAPEPRCHQRRCHGSSDPATSRWGPHPPDVCGLRR